MFRLLAGGAGGQAAGVAPAPTSAAGAVVCVSSVALITGGVRPSGGVCVTSTDAFDAAACVAVVELSCAL